MEIMNFDINFTSYNFDSVELHDTCSREKIPIDCFIEKSLKYTVKEELYQTIIDKVKKSGFTYMQYNLIDGDQIGKVFKENRVIHYWIDPVADNILPNPDEDLKKSSDLEYLIRGRAYKKNDCIESYKFRKGFLPQIKITYFDKKLESFDNRQKNIDEYSASSSIIVGNLDEETLSKLLAGSLVMGLPVVNNQLQDTTNPCAPLMVPVPKNVWSGL